MKKTEKLLPRNALKLLAVGAASLLFAGFAWSNYARDVSNESSSPPVATEIVLSKTEKSRAAFLDAYKVFMSPRCANCHPGADTPTQGDEMTPHTQGVTRGADGKGKYGMKCTTCHQAENLEGENMPPGVPNWHMPPADMKMVFQGRSARQLCEQFKDPKRNGGKKTLAEAMEHLKGDPLVTWGWTPGNGRSVPPLTYDEFMKKMNEWIENGGACPE